MTEEEATTRDEDNQDRSVDGWHDSSVVDIGGAVDSPTIPSIGAPNERIVRTEITHYVRVTDSDLSTNPSPASQEHLDHRVLPKDDERLTARLVGGAMLAMVLLLGAGLYLGSRSDTERVSAVIAELPSTERVFDDFVRNDAAQLGEIVSGETPWSTVGTEFSVGDGQAMIGAGADGERGIAIVDTGWSDATIGATVATAPVGTGLVFRFVDIFNYWALTAAPDFGTWNLVLVVDGETIRSEATGLSSTDPGVRLSIRLEGPEIQIFVDGSPMLTIIDPSFETATSAGLISSASSDGGFLEFYAIQISTDQPAE